jgi:peptidylprolyl isomerase
MLVIPAPFRGFRCFLSIVAVGFCLSTRAQAQVQAQVQEPALTAPPASVSVESSDNASAESTEATPPAAIGLPPTITANSAEEVAKAIEEMPEEYKQELQARIDAFRKKKLELMQAIGDQRELHVRYVNREQQTPERREAYFRQRDKVRTLLDELYASGLSIMQIGFDEEAATFMATWIQNRYVQDIYDASTMEGAARLIDGGSHLKYLFESAARSAVVCGEFEMATKIYEAMLDENQEDVDNRLEFNLEKYREQWLAENQVREKEILEDRLPRVLLKTSQGDVVVELFIDQAPSTVAHFIRLVDDGFYNGLDFYQVIDHLLALTGDPTATGSGNCGRYLQDEHARPDSRKALRGSLLMAKLPMTGADEGKFLPNSASSQFAILLLPILSASEEQTVFGTVIEGMDVVSRFQRVDPHKEKQQGEVQLPVDSILEAKVIRRPPVLPEPQYVNPRN